MACHREACGSAEGAGEGETDERGCGEEEGGCWSLRGLVSGEQKVRFNCVSVFCEGKVFGEETGKKREGSH